MIINGQDVTTHVALNSNSQANAYEEIDHDGNRSKLEN